MIAVYIILGILGYILMTGLIHLFYRLFMGIDDIVLAVVWPLSFPALFIYTLYILLVFSIKWAGGRIKQLYNKYL